jgi:hypothetical protein
VKSAIKINTAKDIPEIKEAVIEYKKNTKPIDTGEDGV